MTIKYYSTIAFSVLLSGCVTTGGFEPARKATSSFSDGAAAGQAFVDIRNAKLRDAERLSLLQWHTANTDEGDSTRVLQPGDSLIDSNLVGVHRLAKNIVCNRELVADQGTFLMQISQTAAKSLKAFDYEESETTLGNLSIILGSPKPAAITLNSADQASSIEADQKKRIFACGKDYDYALGHMKKPIDGSMESAGLLSAAGTAYTALKELDKKIAGVLKIVADMKRRAEFNEFIEENRGEFEELRDELTAYAETIKKAENDAIRRSAMMNYIFTFEDFARSMVTRKVSATGTLFALDVANLSDNKKAAAVIDAANSYNSAVNANPAKPIRKLAGSIDDLLALTDPPNFDDLYKQYESAKAFYEAIDDLAKATKDEELRKSLKDFMGQL